MSHHTTDNQATNTAGLVMIAALAGAAAALLFAPKRGTEMREELKGRYNDMKSKSQSTVQDTQEKTAEAVESAAQKVKDTADKSKDVADQAASKARSSKKETSNALLDDESDVFRDSNRPRL